MRQRAVGAQQAEDALLQPRHAAGRGERMERRGREVQLRRLADAEGFVLRARGLAQPRQVGWCASSRRSTW
jgi:hypothetical protein